MKIRLKIVSLHLGDVDILSDAPTPPKPQAPMKTDTTVPTDGPIISYGSGLGMGWHSHFAGWQEITFDSGVGSFYVRAYINTRVPSSLPTWPRALSLRPDLSERVN